MISMKAEILYLFMAVVADFKEVLYYIGAAVLVVAYTIVTDKKNARQILALSFLAIIVGLFFVPFLAEWRDWSLHGASFVSCLLMMLLPRVIPIIYSHLPDVIKTMMDKIKEKIDNF